MFKILPPRSAAQTGKVLALRLKGKHGVSHTSNGVIGVKLATKMSGSQCKYCSSRIVS